MCPCGVRVGAELEVYVQVQACVQVPMDILCVEAREQP